ncbi:MAG: acyl carrier protein [Fibrobacterales bacterium]
MTPKNEEKLTQIFQVLFSLDELVLTNEMNAQSIQGWDSLNHIKLMLQIESAFNISFSNDDIAQNLNVGDLKVLIDKKLS